MCKLKHSFILKSGVFWSMLIYTLKFEGKGYENMKNLKRMHPSLENKKNQFRRRSDSLNKKNDHARNLNKENLKFFGIHTFV